MAAIPEHLLYDPSRMTGVKAQAPKRPTIESMLPLPVVKYKGKTVYVTQSMMKDFAKLEMDEFCPKQFFYKYILKQDVEARDTVSMNLGKRFEYLLTGQTDKYNNVPEPFLTNRGEPSAEEKRVRNNADKSIEILQKHGFSVKRLSREVIEIRGGKTGSNIHTNGMGGTLDLLTKKDGEQCIVDIKYSGLLGDKWSEFGWYWEDETHHNHISKNAYQRIQATHYTLLYYLRFGKKLPFYYAVFDNRASKEGNYRIFRMNISDDAMALHLREVRSLVDKLKTMLKTAHLKECEKNAFCPVGSFDRCGTCKLAESCTRRVTKQDEIEISI